MIITQNSVFFHPKLSILFSRLQSKTECHLFIYSPSKLSVTFFRFVHPTRSVPFSRFPPKTELHFSETFLTKLRIPFSRDLYIQNWLVFSKIFPLETKQSLFQDLALAFFLLRPVPSLAFFFGGGSGESLGEAGRLEAGGVELGGSFSWSLVSDPSSIAVWNKGKLKILKVHCTVM